MISEKKNGFLTSSSIDSLKSFYAFSIVFISGFVVFVHCDLICFRAIAFVCEIRFRIYSVVAYVC